jgi:hypothetical protein
MAKLGASPRDLVQLRRFYEQDVKVEEAANGLNLRVPTAQSFYDLWKGKDNPKPAKTRKPRARKAKEPEVPAEVQAKDEFS